MPPRTAPGLPPGYLGNILHIDLAEPTTRTEELTPDLARRFFGGRGLGVALLTRHFTGLQSAGRYRNAFAEVDPYSPDNVLIIASAPTTGTRMPTSGRLHMNYKSPLTGCCIVAGYGVISTGATTLEQAAHNASSAERIAQFRTEVFINERILDGPPVATFEPR